MTTVMQRLAREAYALEDASGVVWHPLTLLDRLQERGALPTPRIVWRPYREPGDSYGTLWIDGQPYSLILATGR